MLTAPLQKDKTPPTRLPVGYIVFVNRILVAEQFVTRQLKWSYNLQHATLVLTGLHRQLEKHNLINWQVMLSPSTYMIFPTILFKLLLRKTSTKPCFIFKVVEGSGWRSNALRYQNLKPFNSMQTNEPQLKIKLTTNYLLTNYISILHPRCIREVFSDALSSLTISRYFCIISAPTVTPAWHWKSQAASVIATCYARASTKAKKQTNKAGLRTFL